MKINRLIALGAIALAFAATAAAKEIKELKLTTEPPMHCASCETRIKKALKYEKGVKDIVTDIAKQCVAITYDADKTTPEKLTKALLKEGFESRPFGACSGEEQHCSEPASSCSGNGSCCESSK